MRPMRRVAALVLLAACGPAQPEAGAPPRPSVAPLASTTRENADGGVAGPAGVPGLAGLPGLAGPAGGDREPAVGERLDLAAARRYLVRRVNADRAKFQLPPVLFDEGPATIAAQRHAEDLCRHGFLGHWGSDGSIPEQRYSEAGGRDMVLENALGVVDEKARKLQEKIAISAAELARAESLFFDEVPPHDGHRKNILTATHTHVGIGIAVTEAPGELGAPCIVQEFLDRAGTFSALPKAVGAGEDLALEATVPSPLIVGGFGLAFLPEPLPLPIAEANRRRSYAVPAPTIQFWPKGFRTPLPVAVDAHEGGARATLVVPAAMLPRGASPKQAGLLEVSVWARAASDASYRRISLRTVPYRP